MKPVPALYVALPLVLVAAGAWVLAGGDGPTVASPISGQRALDHVEAMVAIGPRPAGSTALTACRDLIAGELEKLGFAQKRDLRIVSFEDPQHAPNVTFHNIEAEIPGTRQDDDRLLVLGSHYDTKATDVPDSPDRSMRFVGANDGGSSSGLLLELARHFKAHPLPCRLLCVWFDGEESIPWNWDGDRALFGSKKCVARLRARYPADRPLAACVPVMVLLDMVGAKDLAITREEQSSPELTQIVARTARSLGYAGSFFASDNSMAITDDHEPFLRHGIAVLDLIQFGGGAEGVSPWWHTAEDDLPLVSAASLAKVGHVVAVALPEIAGRFYQ